VAKPLLRLRIRAPRISVGNVYGLDVWNAPDAWVDSYEDLAKGSFFAEDIFGNQFCIKRSR
jgi:hypothetical protein